LPISKIFREDCTQPNSLEKNYSKKVWGAELSESKIESCMPDLSKSSQRQEVLRMGSYARMATWYESLLGTYDRRQVPT
jgi:hypothetical protein